MVKLSPAEALVFIDERFDSIDDGYFAIDMTAGGGASLPNVPGDYHSGACGTTFADVDGNGTLDLLISAANQHPHHRLRLFQRPQWRNCPSRFYRLRSP